MSNEFVPNNAKSLVERGFMTGRDLTLGGVRADVRETKGGSKRVGMRFFFTEVGKDGERRILSGFMHEGAWGDQMEPSDNKRGLVPVSGADRPFVEKASALGMLNASVEAAGMPAKLMTGDYSKWVGMVCQLEEKALPSFRRKKSVDPDEPQTAVKEYKTEVVSKIITLPGDNEGYTKLTEKEITAHLKEISDKSAARKAAAGGDEEPAEEPVESTDDEEPVKPKREAKPAPVEDDDDVVTSDDDDAITSDDDSTDDDITTDDEEPEADPAEAAASKAILKALKAAGKGGIKAANMLQKIHPLLTGTDKKTVQKVQKLAVSRSFLTGLDGVTIKKDGTVVLA
jgi:hypothetical protein